MYSHGESILWKQLYDDEGVIAAQPLAQWRHPRDSNVPRCKCLCGIEDAYPPLLLLLLSSLLGPHCLCCHLASSSPLGIIFAIVAIVAIIADVAVVAVIAVLAIACFAPAASTPAAIIIALAVVATTVLAVAIALVPS